LDISIKLFKKLYFIHLKYKNYLFYDLSKLKLKLRAKCFLRVILNAILFVWAGLIQMIDFKGL